MNISMRKSQAEERRNQILDSALKVFAEKGYSRTTIKELANAAGTSEGLMYHYFSSKQQLFEIAVQQYSFLPQLQNMLDGTEAVPCRQILKVIGHGFLALLDQRSRIIDIFLNEGSSNKKVHEIWANLVRQGISLLREYLSARIETGELRTHNPEVTARCLFSSILAMFFTRDILKSDDIPDSRFIDELVDNLLDGIENRDQHPA